MRTAHLTCAMVLAAALAAHAAQPTKAKQTDDKATIVVTGCIDGSWLRVSHVDGTNIQATRYKLRGSKQLVKELEKKYSGHEVEVTGIVTDNGSTTHRGKTIEVGKKTRIYTGAKEAPEHPTGAGDPTLEIASFRDLMNRCK
jgi:hypothetical protein